MEMRIRRFGNRVGCCYTVRRVFGFRVQGRVEVSGFRGLGSVTVD